MTTFIDTCVLISGMKSGAKQEAHTDWAKATLEELKEKGPVIIVDLVYAELSVAMASKGDTDQTIKDLGLERLPNDDSVLFRAGQALKRYRANKGENKRVIADFIIGAAAELNGCALATINGNDFKTYFPKLTLIQPSDGPARNPGGA